ncbi:721_t:CDS:2, partial [Racocetra persica]
RSGKTNKSSSQPTLSQDSGNTEPKKIKKTKYKKRIEKQPKLESNDIGPEISSDWERDIGDIESVELKDERLVVFVAWNSGVRSMHYVEEVNQKAPQRMLGFYQHHLKIKKFVRKNRWYCF